MSVFLDLSAFALGQVVGGAIESVGIPGGSHVADGVRAFVRRHFTTQYRELADALARSNERAWKALECALAGDGLWQRGTNLVARADDRVVREHLKTFLAAAGASHSSARPELRAASLRELRAARRAGLLTDGELGADDLSQRVASFAGLIEAPGVADGDAAVIDRIARQLPADAYPHLRQLLELRHGDGPPLLTAAARYFFRAEVQASESLSRGLSFDKLERIERSQRVGFDALSTLLTSHAESFDQLLTQLADLAQAAAQTHAAVLDVRDEQKRQGGQVREMYDVVIGLQARFDLMATTLRPRDSFSIRPEEDRRKVRDLLSRFDSWPAERRRKAPALHNALGMLEVGAGEYDTAGQIFEEVAASVGHDAAARAEAHHNAYLAALERREWEGALSALLRCVEASPAFAPFPFDRYEPVRILGAGGFGTAFLCRHRVLKGRVVVKALNPAQLQQDMDALFSEAQLLEELNHPGIIRIRDAAYADAARTRPYLVMDWFDAPDLEEYVRLHGTLAVSDGLDLAGQMAEAMAAVHASNILHRDLKPSNVLVRREAGGLRVKLIDFGLSLRWADVPEAVASAASRKTLVGSSIAGTLDYSAPEQSGKLSGVRVGPPCDLYSWAKTYCYAVLKTPHPLPKQFRSVPKSLSDVVEDCMAEQPGERPRGFTVVLERLEVPRALRRADAYREAGDFPHALEAYSSVIDRDPNYAAAYLGRAQSNARREDEMAIADFTEAIRLDPSLAPAWAGRGAAYVRLLEDAKAIEDLSEAIRQNPQDAWAHCDRAVSFARTGRRDCAIADYTRAIELDPGNAVAYRNRGSLFAEQGDEERAIADFTEAIRIDPADASAHGCRGASHVRKGDNDAAVADLTEAIRLDPKYVWARCDRGLAWERKGEAGRAAADYRKALEIDPTLQAADDMLRRVVSSVIFTNSIGMKLVRVEPGEFLMGSPSDEPERSGNEAQHRVAIVRPFMMGVHPVTRGQFAAFVAESGYTTVAEREGWASAWTNDRWEQVSGSSWRTPGYTQTDDHPVAGLTWHDANAFCLWLSGKEGKRYALPSEAQWEYACRAGTRSRFSLGDGEGDLDACGWYLFKGGVGTKPVGRKRPNAWGLYDMHGNVWEWCAGVYADYPHVPVEPVAETSDAPTGATGVLRGGSWSDTAAGCRSAFRFLLARDFRFNGLGFRVALGI